MAHETHVFSPPHPPDVHRPSKAGPLNSFVCRARPSLRTHSNTRNSNVFIRLLHDSLDTQGVGVRPSLQLPHSPCSAIIVGLTNAAISANVPQRGYPGSHDA